MSDDVVPEWPAGAGGDEVWLAQRAARIAAACLSGDVVVAERLQSEFGSVAMEALAWKFLAHFLFLAHSERESVDAATLATRFARTLAKHPSVRSEGSSPGPPASSGPAVGAGDAISVTQRRLQILLNDVGRVADSLRAGDEQTAAEVLDVVGRLSGADRERNAPSLRRLTEWLPETDRF